MVRHQHQHQQQHQHWRHQRLRHESVIVAAAVDVVVAAVYDACCLAGRVRMSWSSRGLIKKSNKEANPCMLRLLLDCNERAEILDWDSKRLKATA